MLNYKATKDKLCLRMAIFAFSKNLLNNLLVAVVMIGIWIILRLSGVSFEITNILVGIPAFILFYIIDDFSPKKYSMDNKVAASNKFSERIAKKYVKEIYYFFDDLLIYSKKHQKVFALDKNDTFSFQLPLGCYFKERASLGDNISLLWKKSILKVDHHGGGNISFILIDPPEGWGLVISVAGTEAVILNFDHYHCEKTIPINGNNIIYNSLGIFPFQIIGS